MTTPTMIQYDRDYSLYVGYGGANSRKGILIKDLQITFDVEKVINNRLKLSQSTISIYNLNREQTAALQEPFVDVRLLVGYKNTGLVELCLGNSVKVQTEQQGPDRITTITVGEAFSLLNNTSVFGTIPAGKTIGEVIEKIAKDAGLTIGTFDGEGIKTKVLWGYPIEGTAKQQLDEISASYRLNYSVSGNVLSVRDEAGTLSQDKNKAFKFNENSGLLEIPFFESWNEGKKKKDKTRVEGVCIKALLNPAVIPGKLINLQRPKDQVGEIPNGFYLVRSAKYSGDFRGGDWTMELKCDNVLLGDYD